MAHFAQIDENNNVINVIVINNEDVQNLPFPESESVGITFCKTLFGEETNWLQTSYNSSFRSQFACIGGFYDSERDIFVGVPPVPTMIYDRSTGLWLDTEIETVRSIVEENKNLLLSDEDIMTRMITMKDSQ